VLETASSEPPLAPAPLIFISTFTDAAAKALPALSAKSARSEVDATGTVIRRLIDFSLVAISKA
jgi:hypothetical protein